jgi:hexosaminidase
MQKYLFLSSLIFVLCITISGVQAQSFKIGDTPQAPISQSRSEIQTVSPIMVFEIVGSQFINQNNLLAVSKKAVKYLKFALAITDFTPHNSKNLTPDEGGRMNQHQIIPQPTQITFQSGTLTLSPQFKIFTDSASAEIGTMLAQRLHAATGWDIPVAMLTEATPAHQTITLQLDPRLSTLGPEGYRLSVQANQVMIVAFAAAGAFYACQTLCQLLPPEIESAAPRANVSWTLPYVDIEDRPRFSWRGLHLDVVRHFMPKDEILRLIDLLAAYKMNVFHWHLTDDQGWRIEIPRYPKLTEIGAWRLEDGQRYGGFYTQADIREIVAYAQARCVTIVPEIELPGHALAALAAYPELSCTGGPFEVATTWGIFQDVYCAGNDRTFEFLENVLTDVLALFPSHYIHIGGDECPKERWNVCPLCRVRMAKMGLRNAEELQSYVIRRIEQFLSQHHRRLIGWDEILEGGLAPQATVMAWRGMLGGIMAAQQGHDVVMTPTTHCYFDHYQAADHEHEPQAFNNDLPLEQVYALNPTPPELSRDQATHILGVQANMWTEYAPTPERVEYMLLPRLCALAEVAWSTPESRNLDDFLARLAPHYTRFDLRGLCYRHHADPSRRKWQK